MDKVTESAWTVAGTAILTVGVGLPTALAAFLTASVTGEEWPAYCVLVLVPSLFAWRLLRGRASVLIIVLTAAIGIGATLAWLYLASSGWS